MLPSEDTAKLQKHRQTESEWVGMILQANSIHRRAILIFDKINLKITKVTRDKDRHFITIKGALQQEHMILLNIYARDQQAPKYEKEITHRSKGRNRLKHNHSWGL